VSLDTLSRMEYKYFRAGKADELLYGRGPFLVHMLRSLTGERAFRDILKRFCLENTGRYVNISLFQKTVEEVTGENYGWFFQQWVRGWGIPDIYLEEMDAVPAGEGFLHRLSLRQTCDGGLKKLPLPVMFRFPGGGEAVKRIFLTGREAESFEFLFPEKAEKVALDPEEETLCRVHP
jgi:aminopeptidase N